jgi:flagellar biosynthetic protein FliR
MNSIILDQEFINMVESWLWPFFRIGGLFMAAPVIGTRSIPVKVRLIIAIAVTIVIVPLVDIPTDVSPVSFDGFLVTLQQILIGIAMGLTLRVVFVALELAGQVIGQLMGLLMASMLDPSNGTQVPIISQVYLLLASLLFLSIDGHLIMIAALAESFQSLPISSQGISSDAVWTFLTWISSIMATAVIIALPAIASLLIVNISFGVMTRAAPQLNIFAVGFPIMIVLGVLIIMLTLGGVLHHIIELFDNSFLMMSNLIRI